MGMSRRILKDEGEIKRMGMGLMTADNEDNDGNTMVISSFDVRGNIM